MNIIKKIWNYKRNSNNETEELVADEEIVQEENIEFTEEHVMEEKPEQLEEITDDKINSLEEDIKTEEIVENTETKTDSDNPQETEPDTKQEETIVMSDDETDDNLEEEIEEHVMKEKPKHLKAYRYFFSLIEKEHETTEAVELTAEHSNVQPRTVWKWYKEFNWNERANERILKIQAEVEKKENTKIADNKINSLEKEIRELKKENHQLKQDKKEIIEYINETVKTQVSEQITKNNPLPTNLEIGGGGETY